MSSPTSPSNPTPASAIPALIFQHDAESLALEDEAARMAAGPLRNQLADLLAAFHSRWVALFGGKPRAVGGGRLVVPFLADLRAALQQLDVSAQGVLADYAAKAHDLGIAQGYAEAGLERVPLQSAPTVVSRQLAQRAEQDARRAVRTSWIAVAGLKDPSWPNVRDATAPASQAANILDRAARTVANTEVNAGISRVADELQGEPLWIAERDACVHCLALSGHLIGPDGLFDPGLTFGTKPLNWLPEGGLTSPPRHPNCRCRITIWFGHDTAGAESITHDWASAIADAQGMRHQAILLGDRAGIENANRAIDAAHKAAAAARQSASFDLPAALRREAERSVLKGWALPSEPDSVRVRAADRLIARINSRNGFSPSGWKVPKSVKTQTEKRLDKGTFGATPFPR